MRDIIFNNRIIKYTAQVSSKPKAVRARRIAVVFADQKARAFDVGAVAAEMMNVIAGNFNVGAEVRRTDALISQMMNLVIQYADMMVGGL